MKTKKVYNDLMRGLKESVMIEKGELEPEECIWHIISLGDLFANLKVG